MNAIDSSDLNPLPEHEWLSKSVGKWDVHCEYYYGENQPAITASATDEAKMFGPFWLVEEITIDMIGGPIHALACTTFSPMRHSFVTRWVDSSMPYPFRFEGTYSRARNQMSLRGRNYDPVNQIETEYHSLTEYPSDDERVLKLSVEAPDGEETPILTYRFTRAK